MAPARIVKLRALPRLPNGKIDEEKLPDPFSSYPSLESAASTPLQSVLHEIFARTLGTDQIGIDDDFFESGGDSLLAASLFIEIEHHVGRRLPLSTLYDTQTIRGMGELLSVPEPSSPWSPLVPIRPQGMREPFFCIHGVGGNVVTYRPLGLYLRADRPLYGLQSVGLNGVDSPLRSIESMAARYVAAIR